MSAHGSCVQLRVRAGRGATGERLRTEATILRLARHPGVEELREAEDDGDCVRLATTWIDGRHPSQAVSSESVAPFAVVAGLLAVLSTTVADLHDIGVVHGSITDRSVIVNEGGQPVLVGFETARRLDDPRRRRPSSAEAVVDVIALGALLAQLVELVVRTASAGLAAPPAPAQARWRRRHPTDLRGALLQLSDRATRRRAATPAMTARDLADALAVLPGATLPRFGAPISPTKEPPIFAPAEQADDDHPCQRRTAVPIRWRIWRRRRECWARAGLVSVGLLAVGLIAGGLLVSRTLAAAPHRPRAVDTSSREPGNIVSFAGGVLRVGTDHYTVGEAGDAVLLGRWMCDPRPTVALVRRRDQSVWIFRAWPQPGGHGTPGTPLRAVPVARVAGLVDAQRRPFGRCDTIWLRRANGSVVTLRPWAGVA